MTRFAKVGGVVAAIIVILIATILIIRLVLPRPNSSGECYYEGMDGKLHPMSDDRYIPIGGKKSVACQ